MVLLLYTVTEEQRWELVLWKVCRYSPVTLCLLFLQKTRFNFSAPSVLLCWLWNSLFITFPSYLAFIIIIICAHLSRTETWFHFKNNLQLTSASVPVSTAVPLTPQAPFSTINTRHGSRAFLSDTAERVKRLPKLIGQMETETTRYHLMILLLLPLQGDAFNTISHDGVYFPAGSEFRADEAVTTHSIKYQRAAGIIPTRLSSREQFSWFIKCNFVM